jgi:L-ascorbate metabolism protein UlaG (beta-lactamase superfamily)
VKITWLGTAGFRIETSSRIFLIDPYITRNREAKPKLDLTLDEISRGVTDIFLSHGHFDHAMDVHNIANQSCAVVYCSRITAKSLLKRGLPEAQLHICKEADSFDLQDIQASCFQSSHFIPDLNTLFTALTRLPKLLRTAHLALRYPMGQVLAWQFIISSQNNFRMLHFGSSGFPEHTLCQLEKLGTLDLLLLPMVGRSNHHHIAGQVVRRLQPKLIIPHHHDDFYPPISSVVSSNIPHFTQTLLDFEPPVDLLELPLGGTRII